MVANAHLVQEAEGKKLFDLVYLVGVIGMILALGLLPFVLLLKTEEGILKIHQCRGSQQANNDQQVLFLIANAFCLLGFVFILPVSLRTRKNLGKLQEEHSVNLPSKNVMTYLDTQILCLLLFLSFLFRAFASILFKLDMVQWKNLFLVNNLFQLVLKNISISFLFPIYILLKTRRYLPRLWDDNSPMIVGNNDFYAVRLSQISPHLESQESRH